MAYRAWLQSHWRDGGPEAAAARGEMRSKCKERAAVKRQTVPSAYRALPAPLLDRDRLGTFELRHYDT